MTRPLLHSRPLLLALLLLSAPALRAQSDGGAIEDSATGARAYWRDGSAALADGDSLGALALLDSAATIWPRQSAYVRGFARLAARLGMVEHALPALDRLTTLGAGWSLRDPALGRIAGDPRVVAAAERNRLATLEQTRSRLLWAVGDSTLLVEGVAADPSTGRWFISSIRQRKVVVRERDGRAHDFFPGGTGGAGAILGMVVDRRRGLLWVTSAGYDSLVAEGFPDYDGSSALLSFDLATGAFRGKVDLPAVDGGHQLGDVIITERGTLFTSDSRSGAVYSVPAGPIPAVAAVVVQGDPAFRSLQGMALSEDEATLYLADYSHGLLRVDLLTGTVSGVSGPTGASLLGIDGMVADGPRRLIGVQNGIAPVRVVALHLDPSGRRVERLEVLDRPPLAPGEATLGVRVGRSFVYVGTAPAVLRTLDLDPR